jgi:hypothetical protein
MKLLAGLLGLFLFSSVQNADAQIRPQAFATDLLESAWEHWMDETGTLLIPKDTLPNIMGYQIVAESVNGKEFWLYFTRDNLLYDVGAAVPAEELNIDPYTAQLSARIMWLLETGYTGFGPAALRHSGIELKQNVLTDLKTLSKELIDLYRKDNLTVQFAKQEDAFSIHFLDGPAHEALVIATISPTLNAIVGEQDRYNEYLVAQLTSDEKLRHHKNPYYTFTEKEGEISYTLPAYKNFNFSYNWMPDSMISKDPLQQVGHFWLTAAHSSESKQTVADEYAINLEINSYTKGDLSSDEDLLWKLRTMLGRDYQLYLSVLDQRKDGDKQEIESLLLARHPALEAEHLFRFTDVFIQNGSEWDWSQTNGKALLSVRYDNVVSDSIGTMNFPVKNDLTND